MPAKYFGEFRAWNEGVAVKIRARRLTGTEVNPGVETVGDLTVRRWMHFDTSFRLFSARVVFGW
jgi:hypothetical protein